MKPTKTYIIRTPNELSMQYSKDAGDQCEKLGIEYEYLEWFHKEPNKAWNELRKVGVELSSGGNAGAQCCWAAHLYLWKKIIDTNEAAVILEHDGMMLHKIDMDIPDNVIVVLGYKVTNWKKYDAESAGPPTEIIGVNDGGHEGSHAYVITPETAKTLMKELKERGLNGSIDGHFFLKSRRNKTKIPIRIMSPTPAIGWIRESTIQKKSSEKNYAFIDSFKKHYKI